MEFGNEKKVIEFPWLDFFCVRLYGNNFSSHIKSTASGPDFVVRSWILDVFINQDLKF